MTTVSRQKLIGIRGETIAVEYLKKSCYKILHRNLRISSLEIDIITAKNELVIFFEVKTRHSQATPTLDSLVTPRQLSNLTRGMHSYCRKNSLSIENVHLDLIIVSVLGCSANLTHYKNII